MDLPRMISRRLLPWAFLALLAGCASQDTREPEYTDLDELTRHPVPVFLEVPDPFPGGTLLVGTQGGFADDVIRAEAWYFESGEWRLIGVDDGLIPHSDRHQGVFRFHWNVTGLEPGRVPVRVAMFQVAGGFGETTALINVLPKEVFFAPTPDPPPINLTYLAARLVALDAIITEKEGLELTPNRDTARDQLVERLRQARSLLDEAKRHLSRTPPDHARAESKIAEARARLKEARAIAHRPPLRMAANRDLIDQQDIELALLEARLWLTGKLGADSPWVGDNPDVALPIPPSDRDTSRNEDGISHWDGNTIHIDTPPSGGVTDDTVFHELDHAWLQKKQNRDLPGGSHSLTEDLADRVREVTLKNGKKVRRKLGKLDGEQLAFSEAWADFSSAAKRGEADYRDIDIEIPVFRKDEDDKEIRGTSVELDVLAMLWDLYDGSPDQPTDRDNDGFGIPFKYLFQALCPRNRRSVPRDISDFYGRLVGVLANEAQPNWTDPELDRLKAFFERRGML